MDPNPTRPEAAAGTDTATAGRGTVARAARRLRVVLGLGTMVMLGLSRPLWDGSGDFPRVPFVRRLSGAPEFLDIALFAVLVGSIAAATAGIAWRGCLGLALVILAVLILGDQQRFQPWAYQFGMIALFLAALPEARALSLARWWYIATYAYSGLSKLDVSFCRELGGSFLEAAVRPLGLHSSTWPAALRVAAILAMPAWEVALAIGLAHPATRPVGRAGAIVLHVALILILGPWGMGHSTIVLVWNAAMLAEVWIAFGPELAPRPGPGRAGEVPVLGGLARAVFLIGVVLPLGERRGYCDAWPAHALYASHVERTEVFLLEDELEAYPPEVRRQTRATGPGPWRRLDLTAWSRDVHGVPVYPQGRACNGLAEALAARYGDHRSIRVVQWGRADRWTGRRPHVALLGLEAIRRQGERYRLNAHPAPGFGRSASSGRVGERSGRPSGP